MVGSVGSVTDDVCTFLSYMVSPLMKNFDAVRTHNGFFLIACSFQRPFQATYLKQHKGNPGIKEGIMRIVRRPCSI
jgi:hypothetical protein